jgi:hypothetical protein
MKLVLFHVKLRMPGKVLRLLIKISKFYIKNNNKPETVQWQQMRLQKHVLR